MSAQLNGNGHARARKSAELLLNVLVDTQDLITNIVRAFGMGY